MTEQPCGVIWDMDGTMIDSTEFHWQSWHDAMAAEDYHLTYDEFMASYGQRNDAIIRRYCGDEVSNETITRISDAKESQYRDMVRTQGISLLPGVQHWLDYLRDHGWRQAVATSAPRKNLETILDVLQIAEYFGALVAGEEPQHGKPDPQIFLLAAERLGVSSEQCIVVEDSSSGVEGGRRGGMRTIGVLTSHDELDADVTVASLDRLPADTFEQLLQRPA
jgi:beta-phosphoglucomutase